MTFYAHIQPRAYFSWDAAEDSEVEREKAQKAAAAKAKADAEAAANKKSKAQRVEEHREANRRRRAAGEDEDSSSEEDEAGRRARLQQTEQDADLKHAQDLFDNVGLGPKTKTTVVKGSVIEQDGQTIDLAKLPLFTPSTKAQFQTLSDVLVPLLNANAKKAQYSLWVQDFAKRITIDLPSTETKKVVSSLTAQMNEKIKEEKAQEKGGKKSKAAKSKTTLSAGRDIGRGVADVAAYGNDDLDDDDFM